MKEIILGFFICTVVTCLGAGQNNKANEEQNISLPIDSATGKVVYQGIIKVDSISKSELYSRAKDWMVRTLKSADNNVNLDDKGFNSLTATGNIMLPDVGKKGLYLFTERSINLKVSIYFKDGRVKYIVENIVHSCMKTVKFPMGPYTNAIEDLKNLQNMNEKWRNETYVQVEAKIKSLLESLEVALKNKKPGDSNW